MAVLTEAGRQARNAYHRARYSANKEREKERQIEHWNRVGEALSAKAEDENNERKESDPL